MKGIAISKLSQNFDKLETEMLKQFFKFVKEKREYKWVHWNMRNENYGFHAIEHRLRVLGGKPFVIPEDKKFDLSKILSGIYGDGYIDDPKLEKLMEKNEISKLNFKTGKEEATLFKKRSYVALHQSTLAKVDLISDLWQLAYMEKLKQKNGWRKVHGSSFSAFVDWLWAKPIFRFAMIILAILGILTYANSFLRFLLTQIL
ncbi:MAG: hypothetical protein MJE68_28860 [Proteobacteria bacterium]|nr:hypothetical protein [Pseudomonadota bacterium]